MSDPKLVIAFDARIGNLEKQLERVNSALKKTNDEAKKTSGSFGAFGSATERLGTSFLGLTGSMARVAGILGVGFGLTAAIGGFFRLAESVGSLGEQADQVGVSIEGLQAWTALGAQFNVSAEGMAGALTRLTRTIGEAAEGNETAVANFNRLNVAFRDAEGNVRPTEDVMRDLAKAIADLPSAAERAAAAVNFFSRTGQQLIPLLVEIGEKQLDVTTRARDMGQVISAEASASFDKFGDTIAEFGGRIRTLIAGALAPLAEAIGGIFEAMNRTLTLGAQASRIRGGEGTSGDLERAQQLAARERERLQQAEATLEQQRTRGRFTDRELRPQTERVAAQRAIVERLEGEVTRIEGMGQAERAAQEQRAQDQRTQAYREFLEGRQSATDQGEARARAAAQGAAALRLFDQQRAAEAEYNRALEDARKRGLALTEEQKAQLRRQAEIIARGASAQAPSGGGTNEATRRLQQNIRESATELERLNTQARTPLEALRAGFDSVATAVETLRQNQGRLNEEQRGTLAAANFENIARNVESAAERTAKAMREAGATSEEIQRQIEEAVRAYGQRLADTGQIAATQIDDLARRAADAVKKTEGAVSGFSKGLRAGLGLNDGADAPGFEETLGLGVGRETLNAFDELFDLLDDVASGSKTASEAITEFAADFVKAVAKIVAQAALLAAVRAVLSYVFPDTAGGGGVKITPRMAGGAMAGNYPYLVGERGPELFVPSGAGRIIPNADMGGGMSVVVNQNAPGVIVEEQRIDERTVMIAVNTSRRMVQSDYQTSMRTGYGPFAEPLGQSYNIRRRL